MSFVFQPWHLFTMAAVGAAQQDSQRTIDYLLAENRVLKKKFGKKHVPFNDDDRRLLAVKGKALGRRALEQVAAIVSPDTILRWHRELVAQKWDHSDKRKTPGRPKVAEQIEEIVLRMAKENPTWGYDRIQGALANVGHEISDTAVGNILKAHGIEPRRSASGRRRGPRLSRPIGRFCRRSTSPRSKSGRSGVWRRLTCCS